MLSLFACTKKIVSDEPAREIRFTSNVQNYSLKSSATSLDNNDLVSLFAGAPVNQSNVRLTVTDGKLVPEKKLYWGYNQNTDTQFDAYYPYAADLGTAGYRFTVATNQSNATSYMLSDLMKATTMASPADPAVHLEFYHQLSKLTIILDNNLGVDIYSVKLKDAYISTDLQNPVGEKDDILAFHATGNTYQLILVPQTSTPSIIVTTVGGGKFEFALSSAFTFKSRKSYTSNLSLGQEMNLTFNVNGWESDGEVNFGQTEGEVEDEDDMTPDPTPQPGMNAVDLGLSVLWASCDLGAEDEMHKGTQAFAWGETTPRTSYASWSNYKWSDGAFDKLTKYNYNADYGTVDNRRQLEAEDDAASVILGNGWRMPTYKEAIELYDYTKRERVKYNGQWVLKLTSTKAGYTDKYIIFAECTSLTNYWTSTISDSRPDEACYFYAIDSPFFYAYNNNDSRITSLLIRPVMDK